MQQCLTKHIQPHIDIQGKTRVCTILRTIYQQYPISCRQASVFLKDFQSSLLDVGLMPQMTPDGGSKSDGTCLCSEFYNNVIFIFSRSPIVFGWNPNTKSLWRHVAAQLFCKFAYLSLLSPFSDEASVTSRWTNRWSRTDCPVSGLCWIYSYFLSTKK